MTDYRDILAWLGWIFVSPLAALMLILFLLSACATNDPCPDLHCEYGYGEAPAEAPAERGDDGDKGDDGEGKGSGKGEKGSGKGHGGKDKGKEGDDD